MIDGRRQSIGPVETSTLEIELAELQIEHPNIIAQTPHVVNSVPLRSLSERIR